MEIIDNSNDLDEIAASIGLNDDGPTDDKINQVYSLFETFVSPEKFLKY